MKKQGLKYIIFAGILLAAFCGLISATIGDLEPYAPDNEVESMNYKKSQVYLDGTGYRLDSYKKKEHKEEEEKHQEIIQKKPEVKKPEITPRTPIRRYVRPTYRTTPRTVRPTTPTKKTEKKNEETKKPVITISIKKGATVKSATKKFTVKATAYDKTSISASRITVKMNGKKLTVKSNNKYVGKVKNGKNTIVVVATDSKGNKSKLTRTFTGKINDDSPKKIGTLSISITAESLGIKSIVAQRKVRIYEDEHLSDVFQRYLSESKDVTGDNSGTEYYELGRVNKKGIIDEIPEDIVKQLEDLGLSLPDDRDSLGQDDFGTGSGWMYRIDGTDSDQYMSDTDPVVDSSVEIYYIVPGL